VKGRLTPLSSDETATAVDSKSESIRSPPQNHRFELEASSLTTGPTSGKTALLVSKVPSFNLNFTWCLLDGLLGEMTTVSGRFTISKNTLNIDELCIRSHMPPKHCGYVTSPSKTTFCLGNLMTRRRTTMLSSAGQT
jgi:hypothetical protein